jgi:acetyl esterase
MAGTTGPGTTGRGGSAAAPTSTVDYVERALPGLRPFVQAIGQVLSSPDAASGATVAEERERSNRAVADGLCALMEPAPPVDAEVDHLVAVDGGEITVRVYSPSGPGPFPAYVYFHGGGFWMGSIAHVDGACRQVVRDAGCVVASVGYRLAPEHRFPTAVHDGVAALAWVVDHADRLAVDARRVAVGGASAGGNLAAVVAREARDRGGPALVAQVLELPVTDLTMSQPSVARFADAPLFGRGDYERCIDRYLPAGADPSHPGASPLCAPDLSGLAPALVMTAELDLLRDEGEAYARRMADAGVDVELHRWDGQLHGTQTLSQLIPVEAARYRATLAGFLRARFTERGAEGGPS